METQTLRTPKQVVIKGTIWTPDYIKKQILESDKAVKAALLRIYSYQTLDEQRSEPHQPHSVVIHGYCR